MPIQHPLPIDRFIQEIVSSISKFPSIIVKAEPGAGKTTRIPMALLEQGNTLVLEPRRLAARLSAEHVAEQMGYRCGDEVGYQVRFDRKVNEKTKLRFMTEGLFLRLIESNPSLDGFQYIVLDEFHERHLDTDLSLALIRQIQDSSRPDLKLIVMSATVDSEALEKYLPKSKLFEIPGKVFPVETQYHDFPQLRKAEHKVKAAVDLMVKEKKYQGHILVFLTGYYEIRQSQMELERYLDQSKFEVLALSADLPPAKQKLVFRDSKKRKVILSTNVAETSLTIKGITGVIDLGQAKMSGFAPWSGLPILQVKKISQASCIQRAGRAGRMQEGICYRVFDQHDYNKRDKFTRNEISSSDLSSLVLLIKTRSGTSEDISTSLPWLSPPPEKNLQASIELLKLLGSLDSKEVITDLGRKLSRVPLHPRLGSIILKGLENKHLEGAILAACLISEDMVINFKEHAFDTGPCDVCFQGNVILKLEQGEELDSHRLERSIDRKKLSRIKKLYQSLARQYKAKPLKDVEPLNHKELAPLILAGFLDRIAKFRPAAKNKRNPSERSFHFCLGRGGILSDYSSVRKAEFIIVLNAFESPGKQNSAIKTQIRFASSVSKEQLMATKVMNREEFELSIDKKTDQVSACKQIYYGQFLIHESSEEQSPDQIERLLSNKMKMDWPYPFEDDDCLKIYHSKLDILDQHNYDHNFPRFEGEMLDLLIHHICEGKTSIQSIRKKSLESYLQEQFSYEESASLDLLCPSHIKLGKRERKIHYLGEQAPFVSSAIQDFFGLAEGPKICENRQTLNLVMLAPNRRPAQITKDLAGFWRGSYHEVRKELARRYPKHRWPENPELET